jgi:hypothetical protein
MNDFETRAYECHLSHKMNAKFDFFIMVHDVPFHAFPDSRFLPGLEYKVQITRNDYVRLYSACNDIFQETFLDVNSVL